MPASSASAEPAVLPSPVRPAWRPVGLDPGLYIVQDAGREIIRCARNEFRIAIWLSHRGHGRPRLRRRATYLKGQANRAARTPGPADGFSPTRPFCLPRQPGNRVRACGAVFPARHPSRATRPSLRGAAHRLRSAGMLGSRARPRRTAPSPRPGDLLRRTITRPVRISRSRRTRPTDGSRRLGRRLWRQPVNGAEPMTELG